MTKTTLLFRLMLCALAVSIALAACGNEVLPQGGNPIPTPRAGEDVGNAPDSQAAATPDETFTRYVNDSIAAQVILQSQKLAMRQRYQNPDQTLQDVGGLLTEITVLENRTKVNQYNDTNATANVDIDICINYADGDSETRTCKYQVALQQGENSKGESVWYVINPDAFPVFSNCTVS
ncbi:MAG: hypothetical protein FJ030_10330 [Chloroflexi bacterium]|nr:hypothetical protein [Chloroflexota bacterium]